MLGYVLRRILMTIPVMGVVALFVFLLLRLAPGDPAAVIAGDYATAEDASPVQHIRLSNPPSFSYTSRRTTIDGGCII
ncbi:MAG: hypothetical protein AAF281_07475, partial [Pseudomonadota bacterium]